MAPRRSKWPKGSKYTTRRGRGRRRSGSRAGGVIVVLLLIVAAVLLIPRIQSGFRRATATGIPTGAQALADSMDAASRRHDWDAALGHALELARVAPHLSAAHRRLAMARHNYGTGVRTVDGVPRTALRTSVAKIEHELAALAAADSARARASNEEEWIAATEVYAKILEYLGLPLDALEVYAQILERQPDHETAQVRAYWVREHLRNPLLPDQL
jgi:tetratricopeptide (TPR) repeat protein